MTKAQAIIELIAQARSTRITKAAYKRFLKACKALNVDGMEVVELELYLEYRDSGGGLQDNLR
jgi:hypothetical protein